MKHRLITLSLGLMLPFLNANAETTALPQETPKLQDKWKKFLSKTALGLEDFVAQNITPATNEVRSVFYPFGGPDITYPFLLFPQATNFVIVGLEFPGNPENIKEITAEDSFDQVESLLTRSFFITSQMCKQLTKKTGVLAPLFLQLKLLGVKEVTVDKPDLPYRGVKITFQHNNQEKTIHYFKMDLSDKNISQQFLDDLNTHQLLNACLIKSSSYIPHQRNFKIIQDFIKTHAKLIIQDDSGVPYKQLQKDYDVKVFGHYRGPYGAEFANYLQKDLPSGDTPLSFCFGYGCRRQYSVMMLAQRKTTEEAAPAASQEKPEVQPTSIASEATSSAKTAQEETAS